MFIFLDFGYSDHSQLFHSIPPNLTEPWLKCWSRFNHSPQLTAQSTQSRCSSVLARGRWDLISTASTGVIIRLTLKLGFLSPRHYLPQSIIFSFIRISLSSKSLPLKFSQFSESWRWNGSSNFLTLTWIGAHERGRGWAGTSLRSPR